MYNFRRSTLCDGQQETCGCVEVATNVTGTVALRDGKDPNSPVLSFTSEEWRSFLAGAKAGEFDV